MYGSWIHALRRSSIVASLHRWPRGCGLWRCGLDAGLVRDHHEDGAAVSAADLLWTVRQRVCSQYWYWACAGRDVGGPGNVEMVLLDVSGDEMS